MNRAPTQIKFGSVLADSIRFSGDIEEQAVSGRVRIEFEYVDPDSIDGTDVIRFLWELDDRPPFKTFHSARYFLQLLIDKRPGLAAQYLDDAPVEVIEAFATHLCIREARELVDDRSYESILISGQETEIRLKYTGLLASLAADPHDRASILVLLSGVIGADDLLEPLLLRVPLAWLATASSVEFDDAEGTWVSR